MPVGRDGLIEAHGRLLALLLVLALLVGAYHSAAPAAAAPGPPSASSDMRAAPEWMSGDTAARLDLGFNVLVPGWVPAPFSGEPRVTASSGYYSLYWMLPGGPPTFLEITGTVGGAIPDFSWYDRNNQLVQNAEVQGYPAYHDLTPAYDLIYWQVDDVVYSVNSQSLAETDSLSLANALEVLTPPVDPSGEDDTSEDGSGSDDGVIDGGGGDGGEGSDDASGDDGTGSGDGAEAPVEIPAPALGVPETVESGEIASVGVDGVSGALLRADAGVFSETGESSYAGAGGFAIEWRAPETTEDLTVTFAVVDPDSGEWLASASTLVLGASIEPEPISASLDCPAVATGGDLATITLYGSGSLVMDVTHGRWPSQAPNTLFDPGADGGGTLVGSLSDGDAASLAWQVPDVGTPITAYVYATDPSGETVECAIDVEPAADLPESAPAGDALIEDGAGDSVETTAPLEEEIEPPVAELPVNTGASGSAAGSGSSRVDGGDDASGLSAADAPERGSADREEQMVPEAPPPPELSDGTGGSGGSSGPMTDQREGGTDTPTPIPDPVRDTLELVGSPAPTTASLPSMPTSPVVPTTPSHTTETPVRNEVVATIGPEGGTLTSPGGATLNVPPGAFNAPVMVRIRPVPDSWLPVLADVELVPGTAFDITVEAADGTPVVQPADPVELSLALGTGEQPSETAIYRVEEERLQRLDGSLLRPEAVAAPVDHFSRFVAGSPIDDGRSLVPWIAAALGLLALLAVGSIVSNSWRRRPRSTAGRTGSPRRGAR